MQKATVPPAPHARLKYTKRALNDLLRLNIRAPEWLSYAEFYSRMYARVREKNHVEYKFPQDAKVGPRGFAYLDFVNCLHALWKQAEEGAVDRHPYGKTARAIFRLMVIDEWCRHHKPTFYLDDQTAAAAILTRSDTASTAQICMPYPSIFVRVPRSAGLLCPIGTGELKPVDGFQLSFEGHPAKNSAVPEIPASLYIFSECDGEWGFEMQLRISQAPTVGALLDAVKRKTAFHMQSLLSSEGQREGLVMHEHGAEAAQLLWQVAINTVLMINDRVSSGAINLEDAPRTPKKQRHRVRRRRGKLAAHRQWPIKINVSLDKQLLNLSRAVAGCRAPRQRTFELARRFMVRGHWRYQACGPGLSERRWVQIEPYMKGPKTGEVLDRTYAVRSEKESDA